MSFGIGSHCQLRWVGQVELVQHRLFYSHSFDLEVCSLVLNLGEPMALVLIGAGTEVPSLSQLISEIVVAMEEWSYSLYGTIYLPNFHCLNTRKQDIHTPGMLRVEEPCLDAVCNSILEPTRVLGLVLGIVMN